MKVILIAAVKSLGKIGDVVEVSEGYARNFLLPKSLALEATQNNMQALKNKAAAAQKKEETIIKDAGLLAQALTDKSFIITRKAGESGKLFGSVSAKDIQEAINTEGFSIEKKAVILDEPIRHEGEFTVDLKLPAGKSARVKIIVKAQ